MEFLKIRCEWKDYYDCRLMANDASCHARVSFFQDGQIIVSDLFVVKEKRCKGLATELLNEIDRLVGNREISIVPSNEWQKNWYEKRNYKIINELF